MSGAVAVETAAIYLAMEAGFGSLWAAEASDGQYPDTIVRIDPATGAVTSRMPAPEPGVKPESSLAVTEDAVWALIGQYEDPEDRSLAAIDPASDAVRDVFPAPRAANSVRGGFGSLWVSTSDRSVVRISPTDGSTQATIETGGGSGFLTVSEDAVWVLNGIDGTVSRINPETNEVEATVRVSEGSVSGGDIAAGNGSGTTPSMGQHAPGRDSSMSPLFVMPRVQPVILGGKASEARRQCYCTCRRLRLSRRRTSVGQTPGCLVDGPPSQFLEALLLSVGLRVVLDAVDALG